MSILDNTTSLEALLEKANNLSDAGSDSSGNVETCTVNFGEIPVLPYIISYNNLDSSKNIITNVIKNKTGSNTFEAICGSAVSLLCYSASSLNIGSLSNALQVDNNSYGFVFQLTAPADGIAGITFSSTSSCCFIAGTQVLTSLTGDTKSIETLKTGDSIVSYNITTGENYIAQIHKIIVNNNSTDIAEVRLKNDTVLTMTAYHPIYTKDGFHSITRHNGYDELVIGDIVKTVDGWSEIVNIERYEIEPVTTYTLDVRDIDETIDNEVNDTFYANGTVVHNAICS